MTAVTAVIFDMDDTLYPERDYVLSGYVAVSHYLQDSLRRTDNFAAWMWRHFLEGNRRKVFNAMSDAFELNLSEAEIGQLVEVYRHHRPVIGPWKGIRALLESLHRAGRRLGVVSDGFLPAQQYKWQALSLAELFDAVMFTESLGRECWKPSPAGFEKIALDLGVEHGVSTYVSDNPAKDFVAPNALGWRTIQLRFDGQLHADNPAPDGGEPQRVVDSVKELTAALL